MLSLGHQAQPRIVREIAQKQIGTGDVTLMMINCGIKWLFAQHLLLKVICCVWSYILLFSGVINSIVHLRATQFFAVIYLLLRNLVYLFLCCRTSVYVCTGCTKKVCSSFFCCNVHNAKCMRNMLVF